MIELNKCIQRFLPVIRGKTLIVCSDDEIEFFNNEIKNKLDPKIEFTLMNSNMITQQEFDCVIIVGFKNYEKGNDDLKKFMKDVSYFLKTTKSNGHFILYIPHKFYYDPNSNYFSTTPHELLVAMKHIHDVDFNILDFQSFGYDGSYENIDKNKTEYAFHIIIQKASNLFGKKDLSDDPGQLVSLDD